MSTRSIIISVLSDMDYNDGGMMRWSSGRPTAQAERVADRIVRELSKRTRTRWGAPVDQRRGRKENTACPVKFGLRLYVMGETRHEENRPGNPRA